MLNTRLWVAMVVCFAVVAEAARIETLGFLFTSEGVPRLLNESSANRMSLAVWSIFQAKSTGAVPVPQFTPSFSQTISQTPQTQSILGVSNYGGNDFQRSIAVAIWSSANRVRLFSSELVALCTTYNFKGVNIDFENLKNSDRAAFTKLVTSVAQYLHLYHLTLSVSIGTAVNAQQQGPYDYAALGKVVDFVQIMAYGVTGSWSPPGATSPLPWLNQTMTFAASLIPPSKISLGLPAYGVYWSQSVSNNVGIVLYKDVPLLNITSAGIAYDQVSATCSFEYWATKNDKRVAWIECPRGLKAKAGLAEALGLRSIAVWALGEEDSTYWSGLLA